MRRRLQRGFTFIEMGAVITIVVLAAMVALERVSATIPGERVRAFRADLHRLAVVAKERAASSSRATLLRMDGTGNSIEVVQTDSDGNETSITAVAIPDPVRTREFQLRGATSTADEWQISFEPDGTCLAGGIGFWDGANMQFAVGFDPRTSEAVIVDGDIPDLGEDRWQAGELEIRGSTGP